MLPSPSGMLAGAVGRLLTSSFYALNDTRTPLRFAVVRIVLTLVLGYAAAVWLPTWLGFDARWGTAGLTASAGVAGWDEFVLLRRALTQRLGTFAMPRGHVPKLWLAAVSAAGVAWALLWLLHPETLGGLLRTLAAIGILGVFGATYLLLTAMLQVGEAQALVGRVFRRA